MAAIMSLDEPRPRGTPLGERVDRRRVREVEHFFRCKACNGWIDARDYVWVEDHEGPLPHPAGTRSSAIGCTVDQRGLVVLALMTPAITTLDCLPDGAGVPRDRAPRRNRACHTSLQTRHG
jgi:hypothetical protein